MERDGAWAEGEDDFTLLNPTMKEGKSGKVHQFNGAEDYLMLGENDDLSSSGEHSSASTVSAEIYSLSKVLREPLPISAGEVDSVEKEGYLFIQTKLVSQWKRRYCVWKRTHGEGMMLGCYALYYYKDKNQAASFKKPLIKFSKPKDDPRAMGRINATFAHREAFTKREKEDIALALEKQAIPQSKHFVRLASPNRMFSVSADTDEELAEWYDLWHAYLKEATEADQYAFKVDAAHRLEPLIRQQYAVWLEKAASMAKALEANGFFDDRFNHHKRDKAGTLEMESQKSPDTWKRYRFILKGRYLYYYPHNKGPSAKRVVVVLYASTEEEGETLGDGSYVFKLCTPLITYTLKAPHKVAAEEWIAAIERAKLKGKRNKRERNSGEADVQLSLLSGSNPDAAASGQSEGINPRLEGAYLTYMLPDARKEKVYKIKKDSVKIGRSSTNDLTIEDSRLSREHARIDTVNDRLVFVDLGSKRGSKVNHHMCNGRKALKDGDLIKVGRTRMRVFAGKPGKH